ncbi:MAG: tetratricopeptide repeat protein [Nitrospiria bacterium]
MDDFENIYKQARACFEEENFLEAEKLFYMLSQAMPDGCADIYNHLGFIRHQAGDFEQSIAYYQKALEINPRYTEAALNLTIAYNDTEQYEAAKEVFSQAVAFSSETNRQGKRKMDPFLEGKLANEHFNLANTYFEAGLLDEAETQYRQALSMRPNFVDVMTRLGITLREKGAYNEAIDTFNMVKTVKPDYAPAMIHLGITYYGKGFIDLALKEWEAAKQADPTGKAADVYLSLTRKKVIVEERAP